MWQEWQALESELQSIAQVSLLYMYMKAMNKAVNYVCLLGYMHISIKKERSQ